MTIYTHSVLTKPPTFAACPPHHHHHTPTQALRAVDGLCDTCASARNTDGNYFTVVLPVRCLTQR